MKASLGISVFINDKPRGLLLLANTLNEARTAIAELAKWVEKILPKEIEFSTTLPLVRDFLDPPGHHQFHFLLLYDV